MNITTSDMRIKDRRSVTMDRSLLDVIQEQVNEMNRRAKEKRDRARRQRALRKKQAQQAKAKR